MLVCTCRETQGRRPIYVALAPASFALKVTKLNANIKINHIMKSVFASPNVIFCCYIHLVRSHFYTRPCIGLRVCWREGAVKNKTV